MARGVAHGLSLRLSPAFTERFWQHVDVRREGECWHWLGTLSPQGYGTLSVEGTTHRAHRISFVVQHGPIPEGLFVCHRCDNKRCVNPFHLFLGTPKQNSGDAQRKGLLCRVPVERLRLVHELIERGAPKTSIARLLGMGRSTVIAIAQGKWAHLVRRPLSGQGPTERSTGSCATVRPKPSQTPRHRR